MSEHIGMIDVETEPNESDELFAGGENTKMLANQSIQDEDTSESKNHT